jgi:hypothetical protein
VAGPAGGAIRQAGAGPPAVPATDSEDRSPAAPGPEPGSPASSALRRRHSVRASEGPGPGAAAVATAGRGPRSESERRSGTVTGPHRHGHGPLSELRLTVRLILAARR